MQVLQDLNFADLMLKWFRGFNVCVFKTFFSLSTNFFVIGVVGLSFLKHLM